MASGVGFWYGFDMSNNAVLEDLLKDQWYDDDVTPEDFISGNRDIPRSVIRSALPITLTSNRQRYWEPFGRHAQVKKLLKSIRVKAYRRKGKKVKAHRRIVLRRKR